MPAISPGWTAKETSLRGTPKGSSGVAFKPRTSMRGAGSGRAGARRVSGSAAPVISAASSADDATFGSAPPATAPRRRTVALSQSARISSSLWLM